MAKQSLQDEMLQMLEQPVEEIISTTPRAGRSKRSNWEHLSPEQIALVYKKIKLNEKIAAEFKVGKRESAQFFNISDVPGDNSMTQVLSRGQKIRFTKGGETKEDIVVGFGVTGSNVKLQHEGIEFRVAGMSVMTASNGAKAVSAVMPVTE